MNNKRALAGLQQQVRVMRRMMEATPETHMRFGFIHPDGTYEEPTTCADWCYACKLERLQTGFEAVRTTNRRLNQRAQKLEAELAAYRRAVDQWEIDKRGTYIPLRTITAIAKAAGRVIENPRWLLHYERIEQAEKCINAARALHQPIDGDGGPYCGTCTQDEEQPKPIGWWVPFPCPTIQALAGEQPAG